MVNELRLRQIDKENQIASLNAQLVRAQSLAEVERSRIGSSIEEEHRAPFEGMVNATYVSNGTRVNTVKTCEPAHKAVVVIHTESSYGSISNGLCILNRTSLKAGSFIKILPGYCAVESSNGCVFDVCRRHGSRIDRKLTGLDQGNEPGSSVQLTSVEKEEPVFSDRPLPGSCMAMLSK